jgi:RNA polymerase sigma factor (sigma-70 family)
VFAGPAFHPSQQAEAPIAPACDVDDPHFREIYEGNLRLLVAIAVRKFQVPEVDAEALAHEVFLSYLKRKSEIRKLHPWLIGAICHACRYFWRQDGRRTDQLDQELAMLRPDPESIAIVDRLPSQLALREVLDALPPRYARVLRMRYYDGYTVREVADDLGVTAKYTQKLIARCLRMAEQIYNAAPAKKKT